MPIEKFREILRLHGLGYSQCEIARSCAVARSTVQDYVRRAVGQGLSYESLGELSDGDAKALLGKGQRQSLGAAANLQRLQATVDKQPVPGAKTIAATDDA